MVSVTLSATHLERLNPYCVAYKQVPTPEQFIEGLKAKDVAVDLTDVSSDIHAKETRTPAQNLQAAEKSLDNYHKGVWLVSVS